MSNLPVIEVFLKADPLEAVVVSDPPVEVNQPIFQIINPGNFATAEQGELAETALQPEAIADFETTAQLNARDTANRNRANHTGTQTISTISGLQSALDDKATAAQGTKADSALQPLSNISLLTNDAGYLSAIPNGAIINTVARFVQPTKPTTRIGGSALVANDEWYNTTDKIDCYYQGLDWVSKQIISVGANVNLGTASTIAFNPILSQSILQPRYTLFFEKVDYASNIGSPCDNNNYWNIFLRYRVRNNFTTINNGNNYSGTIYNTPMFSIKSQGYVTASTDMNLYLNNRLNEFLSGAFEFEARKVGSPGSLSLMMGLSFRSVMP